MMQVSYQIELLCILFATNQEHYNQRIHGRTKIMRLLLDIKIFMLAGC